MTIEADRQLPTGDEIFVDHVGHFVRDPEAASRVLARMGFQPAPKSVQQNPDGTPTGTGNVTVMLRRGYLEMLFKTAETPLAHEFDASLNEYSGIHLAAFSVADGAQAHARIAAAGFAMRPLVQFSRPVDTESGPGTAAFTVVRLERGAMPEGRIQMLEHRTEHTVWQPRWLKQPNGALGFVDMVIAAGDVAEVSGRFTRFLGRPVAATKSGQAIRLDRGQVQIMTPEAFGATFPEVRVPRLPFMGAYAIQVQSLAAMEAALKQAGMAGRRVGAALVVHFPQELGIGAWVFAENPAQLPWRS